MHTQRARLAASLLGIAGLLAAPVATAAVIHDEAFMGDLSNLSGAPTGVGTLAAGTSTVSGRLANNFENGTEDAVDVFSFLVAAGTQLSAITLNFNQDLYSAGASIALFAGSTSAAPNTALGTMNTRASGLVNGGSLLTAATLGAIGPLGAGAYTFDLRGFGDSAGLTTYSFNLTVDPSTQPVPEPGSAALVAASLLALGVARRRHARRR